MIKKSVKSGVELSENKLVFVGSVDHQSVPMLMSQIIDLGEHKNDIVLDVSQVEKIDSTGLAYFIHWGKTHLQPNQRVKLKGASAQAKSLVDIMRLAPVFDLV